MIPRILPCAVAAALLASPAIADDPHAVSGSIDAGGVKRTYVLHVPPSASKDKPAPLVLVFHGGGGTGAGTDRLTGFDAVSDREGFLVAYPDGLARNWNDGRDASVSKTHKQKTDDAGFVCALIDAVAKDHPVAPRRVYATGISNGAIFTHYLAATRSGRIAAIAPVAGGLADPFHEQFKPEQPVSVLILQGTEDPLVPFHGGGIARGSRGKIIDTDETVRRWVAADGCAPDPAREELPDKNPKDGCKASRATWSKGRGGAEVSLVTIEGGGHTWPGGLQYLPERWIGRTCRDFNAADLIWDFFAKHPKPVPAGVEATGATEGKPAAPGGNAPAAPAPSPAPASPSANPAPGSGVR